MTDRVIRVVIDPAGTRQGAQEVEGNLNSIKRAAEESQSAVSTVSQSATGTAEAIAETTGAVVEGFTEASEAVDLFASANEPLSASIAQTAAGLDTAADAAEGFSSSTGEFDDIQERLAALTDRADNLGESLQDAGEDGSESIGLLSRASGGLRTAGLIVGGLAVAFAAVTTAALVTERETAQSFRRLGTNIVELGRGSFAALREVFGGAGTFIRETVDDASEALNNLRDSLLDAAGVTDFLTREQLEYNETVRQTTLLTDDFQQATARSVNDLSVGFINAREAVGATNDELTVLGANAALSELFNSIDQRFNDSLEDLQRQLADTTINQNQFNAASRVLSQERDAQIASLDARTEAVRNYAEQLAEAQRAQERLDEGLAVFESLQTDEDRLQSQLESLRAIVGVEGGITGQEYARALSEAIGQIDISRPLTELERIGEQGARSLQSDFAEFLFNPLEDGFAGLAESFAITLARMAADALAADIFGAVFGGTSQDASSGLAGFFGSFLSGAFGGGRQTGGAVRPDQAFVVGEGGPELFVPSRSGNIVPNGQMSAAGGGPPEVTVQNINIQDPDEIQSFIQQGRADDAILNVMRRNADVLQEFS